MKLILASASPRRAGILRNAGIPFEVLPAVVDEAPQAGERPEALVQRLAEAKAQACAAHAKGPVIVIAADTVVTIDGRILGKPCSPEEARQMLEQLSGRTHTVLSGIALIRLPDGERRAAVETTAVTFAALSAGEISEYAASGESLDKAGAYAIQGRAGRFIPKIEGCYFNVVGLPLARLHALLRELGWSIGK